MGEQKLLIERFGLTREIMQWRSLAIAENDMSWRLNSREVQDIVGQVEG